LVTRKERRNWFHTYVSWYEPTPHHFSWQLCSCLLG